MYGKRVKFQNTGKLIRHLMEKISIYPIKSKIKCIKSTLFLMLQLRTDNILCSVVTISYVLLLRKHHWTTASIDITFQSWLCCWVNMQLVSSSLKILASNLLQKILRNYLGLQCLNSMQEPKWNKSKKANKKYSSWDLYITSELQREIWRGKHFSWCQA